jgi:polysaccharide biosynthesis transport protein
MPEDKPVHIPRERYPEPIYPKIVTVVSDSHAASPDEDRLHLLAYWRAIVARRWTILAVLVTVVAVTLLWTFKQKPIYQAQVTIQIDRENPNILSFKDIYQLESSTDDTLRTQFEVLKSRSLARRVIQDMHLENQQEFQQSERGFLSPYLDSIPNFLRWSTSTEDSDPLRQVVDDYLRRLDVVPVRLARMVTVTFESEDPKLAAQIINTHANDFIEQNFQYRWEATQKASSFLKQQLEALKSNLEKAEDKLQSYSRENQILFTDEGKDSATEKLRQLEEEYTKAQADRFAKESYDRLVRSGSSDALPQIVNNLLVSSLTQQLAQLQREESELAVTFSPDYPSRKRKRSQIEEIEKAILNERIRVTEAIQVEYAAAVNRETLAADALERQREVVNLNNQNIIQYSILKREVDSDKQLYEGLLLRLNEAGVSADLRASNIRVVDNAEVPTKPVKPRKAINLAVSLVFGLLLGIGLAFLQEYVDDTIKTTEDIDRYMRAPALGLVPKMGSLQRRGGYGYQHQYSAKKSETTALPAGQPKLDLIMHEAPSSLIAEAYRSLRTSLLLSSPDHPPKSVLVTSALPSEGKTVTAINLAISLTQMGARVVLVDADMRKPRIHSVFNVKADVGLSSLLTGTASLKDAIQESLVPNLFIIPCGLIPPNPVELIASTRFRQFLELLPQYFDYVIVDSPPISSVSDARPLSSMCDATIVVIKAFSTSRHHASSAAEHLRQSHAHIVGVVLNDLDVRTDGSYYSYYNSKYAYSYAPKTKV